MLSVDDKEICRCTYVYTRERKTGTLEHFTVKYQTSQKNTCWQEFLDWKWINLANTIS